MNLSDLKKRHDAVVFLYSKSTNHEHGRVQIPLSLSKSVTSKEDNGKVNSYVHHHKYKKKENLKKDIDRLEIGNKF